MLATRHTSSMPPTIRPAARIRRSRRRLTEEQEIQAQVILRSTLPEDGGAWNRAKAHALTNELARIELPDRTFTAYLERVLNRPAKLKADEIDNLLMNK